MKIYIHFRSFILLFGLLSIVSCKTKSIVSEEDEQRNLAILDSLKSVENYSIEIDVVYPFNTLATTQVVTDALWNTGNNANRIDVRADGNYIEIKNDSLKGYLPFFGEQRLNGGDIGGRNTAIQFDEALENLDKSINQKKNNLELNFTARQKDGDNDKYNIKIEIYPNQHVSVDISPVYRTFIKYEGHLANNDLE